LGRKPRRAWRGGPGGRPRRRGGARPRSLSRSCWPPSPGSTRTALRFDQKSTCPDSINLWHTFGHVTPQNLGLMRFWQSSVWMVQDPRSLSRPCWPPSLASARTLPGSRFQAPGFGFRVSGSGSQVSGFRLWVPGFGLLAPGSGFQVPGFGFQVPGSGLQVPGSGLRVSGSGFGFPGSRFRILGTRFWVPSFGFRVPSSGFRVSGSGFQVSDSKFRVGFRVLGSEFWVSGFGMTSASKALEVLAVGVGAEDERVLRELEALALRGQAEDRDSARGLVDGEGERAPGVVAHQRLAQPHHHLLPRARP